MNAWIRHAVLVVATLPTCGCASYLNAIFTRSVSSEEMLDNKLLTMTGERRVAIAVPRGADSKSILCAESLPDAAQAAGGRTGLQLKGSGTAGRSLGFEDESQTALLQTFTRTETSDVIRQLGWQVCNAYAVQAIDKWAYERLLTKITDGAIEVMKRRPNAGTTVTAGGSVNITMGQTTARAPAPAEPKPKPAAAGGAGSPGTAPGTASGSTGQGTSNNPTNPAPAR